MATRLKPLSAFMLVAALAVSSVAIPAAAWADEPVTTEVVSTDSVSPSPETPVVAEVPAEEVAPSPVVEDTAQAPVVAEQPVAPDPVVVPEQPLVVVEPPVVPAPVVETPVAPRQVFGTPGIAGVETCGAVTLTFTYPATVGENDYIYPVDFHWTDEKGVTQTIVEEGNGAPTVVTVSFVSGSDIQSTQAWVSIGEDAPTVFTSDCTTPPVTTVVTVQPEAPLWYDYCGTDRDLSVPPSDTAAYSYVKTVEGNVVYYTLAFNKGYEADGKIQTTWQYSFTNEYCEGEPMLIEEEVLPPTFDDFCGVCDDAVNIPADGEHFSYVEVRQIQDGEIVVDVYAVADEGWYFADDIMTAWSHVFKDDACPIVPPVVVPPVVTPPVVVPPVVTPPAVTTAVVAPITSGKVPGGGTDGADLANTKEQTAAINGALPLGVFGLAALLLGLGFLIKRRIATN